MLSSSDYNNLDETPSLTHNIKRNQPIFTSLNSSKDISNSLNHHNLANLSIIDHFHNKNNLKHGGFGAALTWMIIGSFTLICFGLIAVFIAAYRTMKLSLPRRIQRDEDNDSVFHSELSLKFFID